MQTFVIPGSLWINLVLLVVATILVWVKLPAAEKAGRHKPASKPVAADLGRAIK